MRISSNLARSTSKKLTTAILALTFLVSGLTPALAGAATTGNGSGGVAPVANYCGKSPKPLPAAPDTSLMNFKEKQKAELKYHELQTKYWPTVPACMVLYSGQGKYKQVTISFILSTNSPSTAKTAVCAGQKFTTKAGKPRDITVKIGKKPTIVKCSAGNYQVWYLKKGQKVNVENPASYTAAAVQGNHCTYIHKSGVTGIDKLNEDNSCPMGAAAQADPVAKATSKLSMVYTPNPVIRGEKMNYYIKLESADPVNDPMTFDDCTGKVTKVAAINTADGKGKKGTADKESTQEISLRYSKRTASCLFEVYQNARQNSVKNSIYAGEISRDVTISFAGNDFQNPVTATTKVTFKDKVQDKKQ